MSGLDEDFKSEAGNNSSNDSNRLNFGLKPGVTSIIFNSNHEVDANSQFETAQYGQVDDIGISLTHAVAVLNLRH